MKKRLIPSVILFLLFIALILLLKTTDVAAIGPEGTSVGLSGLNSAVHRELGVSDAWYRITDILGYLAIAMGLCPAFLGLVQLIKRRSLFRVDAALLCLGGLYVLLGILYVLFEKVIINYRPVIVPGDEHVEASFPSSHTMLAMVLLGSLIMISCIYIRSRLARRIFQIICLALMVLIVCGRLISGYHWFTDVLGAFLIALSLLFAFSALLCRYNGMEGR